MCDPKSQTPEEETATKEFLSLNENQASNYYYFCAISVLCLIFLFFCLHICNWASFVIMCEGGEN